MRWPFHFGRQTVGSDPAAAAPAAPPNRHEWTSLPPIQRAIGDAPLTASTPEFVGSLAGSQDPDLSLETLGHHISMDAPHGLVTGIARPIETYAPATEMVGRPRKREAVTSVARAIEEPAPSEPAEPLPTVDSPGEALSGSPLRPVAAVTAARPIPPGRPLTHLANADRAAVAALVAPVQRMKEEAPASAHAAAETPVAPSAPQVTAQRLTLGQSRRLGLGAPLAPSSHAVVERTSTGSPPLDLASSPSPVHRQERKADNESSGADITSGPSEASPMPTARSAQRRAATGDVGDTASESEDRGESSPLRDLLPKAPEMEHIQGSSIAGGVTISPAPAVQRVLARSLPPAFATSVGMRTPSVPLAPNRQLVPPGRAALEVARQVGPVPAVQPMPATPPSLDRAVALEVRPLATSGMSARDWAAGSLPFAASASPSFHPASPMPVVQRVPSRSDLASPAAGGFDRSMPAVSEFAATAYEPVLQREIAPGESPSPAAPTPGAAPPVSVSAAPAAGATPSPQSEQELDELARKLYEPLSARLRRDLLVDRERAGMVTDLR